MTDLKCPPSAVFEKQSLDNHHILALDWLAADAWPATETIGMDGWRLRFADGISRRANSVAPFPLLSDAITLDARISAVERFYHDRDLPPRFQISPAACPNGLDGILADRGYEVEAPVSIQIAPAREVADGTSPARASETAPEDWWDLYRSGFERDVADIVDRARERPVFGWMPDGEEETTAIGLGVLGGGWLGIYGMYTHPARRGGGIGTAVLTALAQWAVEQGAWGLYLQVEKHNDGARRLYERLGFRSVYEYHYRTLWTPWRTHCE